MLTETLRVALRVAEALETCGVRYVVGGSLASSMSGEPRSTLDADFLVALAEQDLDAFVSALGDEFYVDREALRAAIRGRSGANLIHYATSTKVDLFMLGGTPLDEEQLARRQRVQVAADPERHLNVYQPEDILLQRLAWYRADGEVSDRQWPDTRAIVLRQADRLDLAYVRDTEFTPAAVVRDTTHVISQVDDYGNVTTAFDATPGVDLTTHVDRTFSNDPDKWLIGLLETDKVCSTALGKNVRGEGFIGLTRAFMYAGAQSTVASLWKVDDNATTELMRQFYDGMLNQGVSPPAALRAAQEKMWRHPRWKHPFYWAAFVSQGEYAGTITREPDRYSKLAKAGALTGAFILIVVGGLYLRRRLRRTNQTQTGELA